MRVAEMNREQLEAFQAECQKQYAAFQAANLKLDMSRGKPSPKQLDLTNGITTCLTEEDIGQKTDWTAGTMAVWTDCRKQRHSLHRCWA